MGINVHAATTAMIKVDFYCKGNKFFYEVTALFSPERSWVIKKHTTQTLQEHERLHFDIFELYARKIRKFLSTYKNPRGHEQELRKAVDLIAAGQESLNQQYDSETIHGANRVMQKKWELKIAQELEVYKSYSDNTGHRDI